MFKLRIRWFLLLLIILLINLTLALYEDQAGKFDWKLSYIGKAKFAYTDSKRVVIATEENVLASLHIKTGQILWRQILEDPFEQQIQVLYVDKDVITVSGTKNSWYVRGWEIAAGIIQFEWAVSSENKLDVDSHWIINNDQITHVVPIIGSHFEITTYNLRTGQIIAPTSRIPAPWILDLSRCALSQTHFACISSEDSSGQFYYVDVTSESKQPSTKPLRFFIGDAPGKVWIEPFNHPKAAWILLRNNVARLVTVDDGLQVLPQGILSNSRAVSDGDKTILLRLEVNPDNPEKLLKVVSNDIEDFDNQKAVDVQYPLGLGAPHFVATSCKGTNCDLLLSSSDNALTLVKLPEGKISWTREEALSHIVAVEFLELPVSDLDASIEHEFDANGDIVSMFTKRILSQAKQLSSLILGNQLLASGNGLVRDAFGLHKLIIVATSVGKLFAIDTFTGSIVWTYRLPHVVSFTDLNKPKMLLYVQRTARYAPLLAQCLLLAKDAHTGNGILFRFDPISGHSESGIERLDYKIKQAMLLPQEDDNHVKGVLVVSENDDIYIYPNSAESIAYKNRQTTYLYSVNVSNGQLQGYNLFYSTPEKIALNKVWNVHLGPSQLVAFSTRPLSERVHSQGRVLPDRSVYYKYINPNMIAIATVTDDPMHKHVLSVYLIDGVTGLVLYSANHKRAKTPVHLIHSENWLVYTYFSERFRRIELATVELYEGKMQSNSTVFSSHAVSQLPEAQSQAYILPAAPVTISTTLTERGITSKFILLALTTGSVAEIPWGFVQPRLPGIHCGPEENCVPYMPEIPLHPEATVNYNRTLLRVRGIATAPARLESTSHVLVHGLDVFYTRVAPSKTFDVLKEDFEHRLIILVLAGLMLATYATKKLAARKALRQAWK